MFRANSTGTGTVSISAGSYCIAGVDYDASGSASVTIVAADKPDDSEPAPAPTPSGGGDSSTGNNPGVSLSSNNALSSLTVSAGTLTPAFDPAITEYTLPSQPIRPAHHHRQSIGFPGNGQGTGRSPFRTARPVYPW